MSEESQVHDPFSHSFKDPADRVTNICKIISISIKLSVAMKILNISFFYVIELSETGLGRTLSKRPIMRCN